MLACNGIFATPSMPQPRAARKGIALSLAPQGYLRALYHSFPVLTRANLREKFPSASKKQGSRPEGGSLYVVSFSCISSPSVS